MILYPGAYSVDYDIQSIPSSTGGGFTKKNFDLDGNGYSDFLLADGVFPPTPIRPTTGDIIYQFEDSFSLSSNSFSGTIHPREFALGYFNQDSIVDFFIAAHGYDAPPFPGERNVFAISLEQGYLNTQADLTAPDGFTHSAAVGDIDGDGDIDILSVDIAPSPQAYLYVNDGGGFFSDSSHLLPIDLTRQNSTVSFTSSLIHDVDGDGFTEIILGSQYSGKWLSRIYFGTKDGYFSEAQSLLLNDISLQSDNQIIVDIQAIDIDLDGDDDLVTSYTLNDPFYTGAGVQVFRNEGNREFTDVSLEALSGENFHLDHSWIYSLEILDFNRDGVSDVYLERPGGSSSEPLVLLGDGGGKFYPLFGTDVISDRNFDFLLSSTLPSYRDGILELAGAQYVSVEYLSVEHEYIISRINIDQPAIVQLDPKISENFFAGTSQNDQLSGSNGNDVFTPGTGNDRIDGGGGSDTASVPGLISSFTVWLTASDAVLKDRREFGYGQDELVSIERLAFDYEGQTTSFELSLFSKTASLSNVELESFIELYIAYFNRAPDAVGLNFWATAYVNGMSLDEIAAQFAPQPETVATYPEGTSNTNFATAVYNNVLGRVPDQAGLDFWVGVLDAGAVSRDQFILEILRGVEAGTSDRAYLDNKVDVGAYFAVHKGMSDVANATAAMAMYDGTENSVDQAVTAIDDYYQAALHPENGEFLLQVVGVLDNPLGD